MRDTQREGDRERERQRETDRERQRERQRETKRDKETQREREAGWVTQILSHVSVHHGASVHSAIHASQQPTSPIGFLSLKLPPPPCGVLLVVMVATNAIIWCNVYIYIKSENIVPWVTQEAEKPAITKWCRHLFHAAPIWCEETKRWNTVKQ